MFSVERIQVWLSWLIFLALSYHISESQARKTVLIPADRTDIKGGLPHIAGPVFIHRHIARQQFGHRNPETARQLLQDADVRQSVPPVRRSNFFHRNSIICTFFSFIIVLRSR